jgi:hypothetical protein
MDDVIECRDRFFAAADGRCSYDCTTYIFSMNDTYLDYAGLFVPVLNGLFIAHLLLSVISVCHPFFKPYSFSCNRLSLTGAFFAIGEFIWL